MLTGLEFGGNLMELVSVKAEAWQGEQATYDRTRRLLKESPERIFSADQIQKAVATLPIAETCMDEGVSLGDATVTEIGTAGTGAFMTDQELDQHVAAVVAAGIKIETVTYHDNCGAAGLIAARYGLDPVEVARGAAVRMMKAFGLAGDPVRIGYGSAPVEMQRDPRFHHARAILIDGTGRINAPVLGLPSALQISASLYPSTHRLREEVALAETIALDRAGGFGERFTPEQPLLLILVGDEANPDWRLSSLEEKLGPVLEREDRRTLIIPIPIHRLPA
jgi:hypothetical protein